ncbi:hypothetical protein [Shewanella sp. YLB-07]|uniref:hypothetical protein n=1 Tax=Shewanella sp. YLB-07 TaxID=2601268 RepID=UPI00128DD5CE|nr:hypothetical protein [Shewanella sp. YLB-07]MPY24365.1 hypothetical protein [Shewanella sp. YLB-07]
MSTHKNNPVGPSLEELKRQFRARSIPLETDFVDLIDMADCGRKAVGLSPAQDGMTGDGLELDAEDKLAVHANLAKGLVVDSAGVGINTSASHGLTLDDNALRLAVSANNPGVKLVNDGLQVKPNKARGIVVDSSGVGINTAVSHGLLLDNNALKLAVSTNNPGVKLVSDGLQVKPNKARGIMVDSSGVGVNHDSTLQIKNNQLQVASSVWTRVEARQDIEVPSGQKVQRSFFRSSINRHITGSVSIMVDRDQMFTLSWLGTDISYPNLNSRVALTLSNVNNASSNPLTRVLFGHGLSTGYGLVLNLEFSRSCTVEFTYDKGDCFGFQMEALTQKISMASESKLLIVNPNANGNFAKG